MGAERCHHLLSCLTRTKTLQEAASGSARDLHRCLTTFELTLLGIGAMVGSGIYILVGIAAKEMAGPAIIISFLLAGLTIGLEAVCLTEFAARVSRTGSTYLYTYLTLGELLAFLIGWTTVVSAILGGIINSRAWSSYLDSLFHGAIANATETYIGKINIGPPFASRPDFMAVVIMVVITVVVATGAQCSSRVTALFAILNVCVLLFVIIGGLIFADLANWEGPGGFMPYGFKGVLSGSAACYWAFSGYEVITMSVEEAENPKRSIVRAVLASLTFVTLLYVATACALTLTMPYTQIDVDAPLPSAFAYHHLNWARIVVAVGPLCGLTTTLLTGLFSMVRMIYAIAEDGLIFRVLARVNKRTGVPLVPILGGGLLMALGGFCLDLKEILGFAVVLNLAQYLLVSAGVIMLRYRSRADQIQDGDGKAAGEERAGSAAEEDFRYTQISDVEGEREEESETEIQRGGDATSEEELFSLPPSLPLVRLQLRPYLNCLSGVLRCDVSRWVTPAVIVLCLLLTAASLLAIYGFSSVSSENTTGAIVGLTLLVLAVIVLLLAVGSYEQNMAGLVFKVPCVPLVPSLSMLTTLILLVSTSTKWAWVGLAIVLLLGLFIYFGYGIHHSKQNDRLEGEVEMNQSTTSLLPKNRLPNVDSD